MPTFAPDIATLEATAGGYPNGSPRTRPATSTRTRSPHGRRQARPRPYPIAERLAPLYHAATEQAHGDSFAITAAASLRFAEPPKFATPRDAYAFRDALAWPHRTRKPAGQGSTFVYGLFIPGVLAHVGAKFAWATPAEVSDRADRIIEGITRKPVAPPVLGRSVVIV